MVGLLSPINITMYQGFPALCGPVACHDCISAEPFHALPNDKESELDVQLGSLRRQLTGATDVILETAITTPSYACCALAAVLLRVLPLNLSPHGRAVCPGRCSSK